MTPTPNTSASNSEPRGWSLSRIAERLKVAQRTLVDWNRQERRQKLHRFCLTFASLARVGQPFDQDGSGS
jgi:hypothetical protein